MSNSFGVVRFVGRPPMRVFPRPPVRVFPQPPCRVLTSTPMRQVVRAQAQLHDNGNVTFRPADAARIERAVCQAVEAIIDRALAKFR